MTPNRVTAGGTFRACLARAEVHSSGCQVQLPYEEMMTPTPPPTIDCTALCLRVLPSELRRMMSLKTRNRVTGVCYSETRPIRLRVSTAVRYSASYGRGKAI